MKIPFKYSLRNLHLRKFTMAMTMAGIAMVVFVFTAVLMMAFGVERTLVATGSPDNVKIMRKGSTNEISSIIGREAQDVIRTLPHIAQTEDGARLISFEPVVVINLEKQDGVMSNITVRGVSPGASLLRPQAKLVAGRMFDPGLRELVVGEAVARRIVGAQIGGKLRFAGDDWTIVGIFSTGGSGKDSEIWGDARQLQDAFNRGSAVSTITLKLDEGRNFERFKQAFATDRRLEQLEVEIEERYFAKQSEVLATLIKILGIFITMIFSIGATLGAMITIYTSVAQRTVEIGTLRALGFSRRSVLALFLSESVLLAAISGAAGIALASLLQRISVSTMNFGSFSELEFSFALSVPIMLYALIFAIAMGILGGFVPSLRAARLAIVTALRNA